jgi:hypothetical protein
MQNVRNARERATDCIDRWFVLGFLPVQSVIELDLFERGLPVASERERSFVEGVCKDFELRS